MYVQFPVSSSGPTVDARAIGYIGRGLIKLDDYMLRNKIQCGYKKNDYIYYLLQALGLYIYNIYEIKKLPIKYGLMQTASDTCMYMQFI